MGTRNSSRKRCRLQKTSGGWIKRLKLNEINQERARISRRMSRRSKVKHHLKHTQRHAIHPETRKKKKKKEEALKNQCPTNQRLKLNQRNSWKVRIPRRTRSKLPAKKCSWDEATEISLRLGQWPGFEIHRRSLNLGRTKNRNQRRKKKDNENK